MKYKKFNVEYDRIKLLTLFNNSEKSTVAEYTSAFGYSTELLPCMNIFNKELEPTEYGLSELSNLNEFHTHPNNSGLLVFPIVGNIIVTFDDGEKITIDTPIALNGSVLQKYIPYRCPAIFFAIKIPSNVPFEDAVNLLP